MYSFRVIRSSAELNHYELLEKRTFGVRRINTWRRRFVNPNKTQLISLYIDQEHQRLNARVQPQVKKTANHIIYHEQPQIKQVANYIIYIVRTLNYAKKLHYFGKNNNDSDLVVLHENVNLVKSENAFNSIIEKINAFAHQCCCNRPYGLDHKQQEILIHYIDENLRQLRAAYNKHKKLLIERMVTSRYVPEHGCVLIPHTVYLDPTVAEYMVYLNKHKKQNVSKKPKICISDHMTLIFNKK